MQNKPYAISRIYRKIPFPRRSRLPFSWFSLLVAWIIVVFVAGCLAPGFGSTQNTTGTADEATATPALQTIPVLAIAPNLAEAGTIIQVSSAGWQPNAQITVNLEAQQENLKHTLTVIRATADAQGTLNASFVYPDDPAFVEATQVQVVALDAAGQRATTEVKLVALAPTTPAPTTSTPTPPISTATLTPTVPTPTLVTVNLPIVEAEATLTSTPTARPTTTAISKPSPPKPSPTPPATNTARPAYLASVTSSALNVRSGPAVEYAVVRAISRGTELIVLAQNEEGTWLYVRLEDGTEGWVARSFTDYSGRVAILATPAQPIPSTPTTTLTATPTPWFTLTPTPWSTPSVIYDWRGEYYDNTSLSGTPRLVRNDNTIDFYWGNSAPASGLPNDSFSVRWTRNVDFENGRYRFHIVVDDGMNLYVDNILLINEWRGGNVREVTGDLTLGWGSHSLRVEYFENSGEARASLWWERIGDTSDSFPDWKAEYWSNRYLDGNPTLTRNDVSINFNWGESAPVSYLPSDNFSVRWTRWVNFDSGLYRFSMRADDGIRFYLDNTLQIDQWRENDASNLYTLDRTLTGGHWLDVRYYEQSGGARVEFWWQRIGSAAPTDTPYLTPTWTPTGSATPTVTPTPMLVTPTFTPTPTQSPTQIPPTLTPTATATPLPYVNVQPSGASANTPITLNGGNFPANTTVRLYLATLVRASQRSPDGQSYAVAQTNQNGSFNMAFVMPDQWPNGTSIAAGQLVLVVATDNFSVQSSVSFDYFLPPPTVAANPYARVEPSSGKANSLLTVSGGGFSANTTVGAYLSTLTEGSAARPTPYRYATTTTDGNGNYAMSFTMPEKWPDGTLIGAGQLVVLVATDDFSSQTSSLFDYYVTKFTPSIYVQPASGGPGTTIQVSGGGFPAATTVNLHIGRFDTQEGTGNAKRYASVMTNDNGNYNISLNLPTAWPDGSPISSEQLLLMVATNDLSIQVSTAFQYVVPTPTETPLPTDTPTLIPSITPSITPSATDTPVALALPTDTATPLPPTDTPTAIPLPTETATPLPTDTPTPVPLPTDTPTPIPPPTDTPTDLPLPTDTPTLPPVPTDTPVVLPSDTPIEIPLPLDTPVLPPEDSIISRAPAVPTPQVMMVTDDIGTQVTVKGSGFPASTRVHLYLQRPNDPIKDARSSDPVTPYLTTQTDQNGRYSVSFTMPSEWPDGVAIETDKLRIVVAQPNANVQASAIFTYQPQATIPYAEPAFGPR